MMPFAAVLRVVKVFPQVQVTSVTRYSGWMSFFMVFLSGTGSLPAAGGLRRVNRGQGAIVPPGPTPRVIEICPAVEPVETPGRGHVVPSRGHPRPDPRTSGPAAR